MVFFYLTQGCHVQTGPFKRHSHGNILGGDTFVGVYKHCRNFCNKPDMAKGVVLLFTD